ncbi:hypothetical protein D3C80_1833910 [compost metagenome]
MVAFHVLSEQVMFGVVEVALVTHHVWRGGAGRAALVAPVDQVGVRTFGAHAHAGGQGGIELPVDEVIAKGQCLRGQG